jgi:hypothetical protein
MPAYPLHPNQLGEESMSRSLLKVYRAGLPQPVTPVPPADGGSQPVTPGGGGSQPAAPAGGGSKPTATRSPALRISFKRLRSGRVTVRGSVSPGYTGLVSVSFTGTYSAKRAGKTTTYRFFTYHGAKPKAGRWSTTLTLKGTNRLRVRSGVVLARTAARDGFKLGVVRQRLG